MGRFSTASALASAAAIVAVFSAGAARALTIVPTFDISIVNSDNAAAIEGNINSALQFYDTTFSNPERVKIDFQISASVGGGQSQTTLYYLPVASYISRLATVAAADPQNSVLQSASAFSATGNASTHPTSNIYGTSAELTALGYNTPGGLTASGTTGGSFDGVVTVNSGLNFADTATSSQVNAISTFEHEIDEVLGIGGSGSLLDAQAQFPNSLGVLDLYRYSAPGVPSLTTSTTATSYLSFDGGVTQIGSFNQSGSGDIGDWADFGSSCVGALVQNYSECLGSPVISLNRASPEVVALEGIGYNLTAAIPEPATWALMLAGFGAIGGALRRRHHDFALPV